MLVIRQSQMEVFAENALLRFEDELIEHFKQHLPSHLAQLGEDGAREALRYGVQRARAYRIESEEDVAIYVRHMFLFGRDFDLDPQLPWASQVLTDSTTDSGALRIERLAQASMAYLRDLSLASTGAE